MQMSYVDSLINEAVEALLGCIHINWLNPATGLWTNAVYGNTRKDNGALTNYQAVGRRLVARPRLGVGAYTLNNIAWAVLDHNSEFAVVPEPSSMLLLGGRRPGLPHLPPPKIGRF